MDQNNWKSENNANCDTSNDVFMCKPESLYSKEALNEVTRISCYLAGKIEIPDDVPGCNVLYGPISIDGDFSTQQTVGIVPHKSDNTTAPVRKRAIKRKLDQVYQQAQKQIVRTDIEVPLEWNACFSRLWTHVTKHAMVIHAFQQEPFNERLRRIGELAKRGLDERGFFTLKNLLGPEHAMQISQWALNRWRNKPHLFRLGRLSMGESTSAEIRRDFIHWINPESLNSSSHTKSDSNTLIPYVQLLFLYIDAVVRAVGDRIRNRYGSYAVINGKSWAHLSSFCKQSDSDNKAVGYVAHYDNPDSLRDGRILTAMYYLNPHWERAWGGQIVLWPQSNGDFPTTYGTSQPTARSRPLGIVPTLDRFLLFYADQRILHCVQPVLACSPRNERLAIGIWYFDQFEREAYFRSQDT